MDLKDKNLYYVGGVVRDELLGKDNFDIDYCYEGDAIEFAKTNSLNIIKENPAFGTVRVLHCGKEIDIASSRIEAYPRKGHLPIVTAIGCSLEDDVKRRDFTINTLYKRTTDGEIIDFYGGIKDINEKKIKVLHNDSFIDDPSRIIRALKFSIRFGFNLDYKTKQLQDDYLKNINYDISFHRLKKELIETFNLNSQKAYNSFVEQGLYMLLSNHRQIPNLKCNIQNEIVNLNSKYIWLIYMGLFDLSNLDLTRTERRIIEWSRKLDNEDISNNTPSESVIIHKLLVG